MRSNYHSSRGAVNYIFGTWYTLPRATWKPLGASVVPHSTPRTSCLDLRTEDQLTVNYQTLTVFKSSNWILLTRSRYITQWYTLEQKIRKIHFRNFIQNLIPRVVRFQPYNSIRSLQKNKIRTKVTETRRASLDSKNKNSKPRNLGEKSSQISLVSFFGAG